MKGFKIFRIFGIDIEIHWSWFLVFIYLSWVLADQVFPKRVSHQSDIAYWLCGIFTALMLFVSVLIHELAHSKVAQLFKINTQRIVLFFLGGVAQLESLGKKAKEEFLISIVGPLCSMVLVIMFKVAAAVLPTNVKLIPIALSYLSFVNIVIAVFNLLPAYPMDGGRILKSILWWIFKGELKATKIAVRLGQFCGILMIIVGIFNIWTFLMLVGLLICFQAQVDYRRAVAKKASELLESLKNRQGDQGQIYIAIKKPLN